MNWLVTIVGIFIVGFLAFGTYHVKTEAIQTERQLVAANEAIGKAQHRKRMLEAELAYKSDLEWIEKYAKNVLNMKPIRAKQFIQHAQLDRKFGPIMDFSADYASLTQSQEEFQ